MAFNIHIYDLTCETALNNPKIFCQISSIYPIKKIIGKTKAAFLSNKISWNESFITNDIFTKKVKFAIFLESNIEGISQKCEFTYSILTNSSLNINDSHIELENQEEKMKLTFSITRIPNPTSIFKQDIQESQKIIEKIDQNQCKIDDFLSFFISTNGKHQVALIHFSRDQKTLQISCPHFSYIKSLTLQSDENLTSALMDVKKIFPTYQYFFVAIQVQNAESEKVNIAFSTNSNFKPFYTKTIDNANNKNIYVPIFFTLKSCSDSDNSIFVEIESIDNYIENALIQDLYQKEIIDKILKSKELDVKNICTGNLFTGNLQFIEKIDILRLFLKHSTKEQVDMSFSVMSDVGSIDDTCFFNKPAILNKAIKLSSQKYYYYAEYSMIDLSKIPKRISSIVVILTSFIGKPLSKINSIEITLTDANENLITIIPITIEDDLPGFVVGEIQRNDKYWEFKYIGLSCDCKVPNFAAKTLLHSSCSIDDDVEWKDDV